MTFKNTTLIQILASFSIRFKIIYPFIIWQCFFEEHENKNNIYHSESKSKQGRDRVEDFLLVPGIAWENGPNDWSKDKSDRKSHTYKGLKKKNLLI